MVQDVKDGGDRGKRRREAEQQRAALQTRLDEAIAQYTAGSLNLDTLTKVEGSGVRPIGKLEPGDEELRW